MMGYEIKIFSPIFHHSNIPVPFFFSTHYSNIPAFHSWVPLIYSNKKVEIHFLNS